MKNLQACLCSIIKGGNGLEHAMLRGDEEMFALVCHR